jgi:hypothetical protein
MTARTTCYSVCSCMIPLYSIYHRSMHAKAYPRSIGSKGAEIIGGAGRGNCILGIAVGRYRRKRSCIV